MRNPMMSPLLVPEWEKADAREKADIIERLKPKPEWKVGESFQVQMDGSFQRLKPGDRVPDVPVIVDPDRNPRSIEEPPLVVES